MAKKKATSKKPKKKTKKKAATRKSAKTRSSSKAPAPEPVVAAGVITVQEFKKFCTKLFKFRIMLDKLKAEKTEQEKIFAEMKNQAADYLEALQLPSFDTGKGELGKKVRTNVKVTDAGLFHDFLKAEGLYEGMVSVAAPTVKKFYDEREEEAREAGDLDFLDNGIPGLTKASGMIDITMKGYKLNG